MRVVLPVVVGIILMTQGLGVLVAHSHIDVLGDGGRHVHSYVTDADGHNGHPGDTESADGAHPSEQPSARLPGLLVLLALASAVVMRLERPTEGSAGSTSFGRRPTRTARRHPARLALLSILRV